MSSFGGFRDERYFKPGTSNWTGDREAAGLWMSEHGMDQYGGITGPQARVPWNIAMDVQAAHDRGVWNARNRLGASALNFGQGALGNLQSFRPGGGAAEAAGVYQQLAGIQLNRASMLQPLDLLGDLRRHEAHQARKATKKAGTIQAITGLVAAGANALAGNPAGVAAGVQQAGQGFAATQGGGPTGTAPPGQRPGFGAAPGVLGGGGADPRAYGQQGQQANPLMSMGGGGPGGGFMQPGFADAMRAGLGGGGQGSPGGGMTPGSNAASGPGPSSGGSQQERQGGGAQGPGGAGAGGGAGGMAMGGPPPVGVNGDFSPVAFAASASQGGMANPLQPLMETKFRSLVANMLDDDPAWNAIDAAIARQAYARAHGTITRSLDGMEESLQGLRGPLQWLQSYQGVQGERRAELAR